MDASAQRDLHNAFRRSSGGFDLVLGPVLMALIGLWIDSAAGTRPLFTLVLFAFGAAGAVLKVYYEYQRGMEAAEAELEAVRAETERLRAEAAALGDLPSSDFTKLIDSEEVVIDDTELDDTAEVSS
ncbi:MAG: AtpZ/AtpI family protein [Actinomycetota bacterium]